MAETSADRLSRLLVLVPWLAAHGGISKAEAARHFGLTQAQLESDLNLITFTGPGLYGGELVDIAFEDETITVYDAQGLNQPLQLTSDEAASLLVGLQALQQLPDMDATRIERLVEKLSGYSASDLDVRVAPDPLSALIGEAIAAQRDVRFSYLHPLRDDVTERRVTPQRVVTTDGVDYCTGWCHVAQAVRTFRLDRMRDCTMGDVSSAPAVDEPQAPSLTHTALVAVQEQSQHLLERVPATVISAQPLLARVDYADPRWLVSWIMSSGGALRVVEPKALQQDVLERAVAAREAYRAIGTDTER